MGIHPNTTTETFVVYGSAYSLVTTLIGMQVIKVWATTDAAIVIRAATLNLPPGRAVRG
jgi:hypothetical protein